MTTRLQAAHDRHIDTIDEDEYRTLLAYLADPATEQGGRHHLTAASEPANPLDPPPAHDGPADHTPWWRR